MVKKFKLSISDCFEIIECPEIERDFLLYLTDGLSINKALEQMMKKGGYPL